MRILGNRFVQNRRDLCDLIYDMNVFTERELLQSFQAKKAGDILIDGGQTLRDFLEELASLGALRREFERYQVVNPLARTAMDIR